MPKKKKFGGRKPGTKNRPCEAMSAEEAEKQLDSRTAQTVPMAAKILGTTPGAVRKDLHNLGAFQMGRLWFVPSVVIRRRIAPAARA